MARRRALGLGAGGFHYCAACHGSGRSTCRTWGGKGSGVWQITTGRCVMCRGKGGRFQNHTARGLGRMR